MKKRRSQVVQSSTETATAMAAMYRRMIVQLEQGEQTEAAAAQLTLARQLLAIAER